MGTSGWPKSIELACSWSGSDVDGAADHGDDADLGDELDDEDLDADDEDEYEVEHERLCG